MDFVDPILTLCLGIHQMAGNVKANKERYQRVAERVRALEELVLTVKQRGPGQISAVVENALRELCSTLAFAKRVLIKYSQTKKVKSFLKSGSHKDKFRELNERLSENFQVLSGALQIEQVNMLHRVCETFVDFNGQTLTGTMAPMSSPTAPTPLSRTMSMSNPMSMSSPTAPMPLSRTMSMSSPTAPMPLSRTMSICSPTAPMPLSRTMSTFSPTAPMPLSRTMSICSPTAPMPLSRTMSTFSPTAPMSLSRTMSICSPTAPMPLSRTMSTFSPTAPMPLSRTMSMFSPTAPMSLSRTLSICSPTAPMPLPGTMAPSSVLHVMAPCPGAPVPLTTLIAQMTFPPQNNPVVGYYVVNNSFNS